MVGAEGRPIAVLLTLEEYGHYLDVLDDEGDSQYAELAARLGQAAARSPGERQSFRDYLRRRELSCPAAQDLASRPKHTPTPGPRERA